MNKGKGKERFAPDASIIFVGMRGVGKTTVGVMAATATGRPLIDADRRVLTLRKLHKAELVCSVFAKSSGPLAEYVHTHGWAAFRAREAEILAVLLSKYGTGHIISTGGGCVETPGNRDLLKHACKTHPVIHVLREKVWLYS